MDTAIAIVIFVLALMVTIMFIRLITKNRRRPHIVRDRDCEVKESVPGSCVDGTYTIVYDVLKNKSGIGKSCLDVLNDIDSSLTYELSNNQYIGTKSCETTDKDCEVSLLDEGICSEEGLYSISYNVLEKETGNGKDCITVLSEGDPRYNYYYASDNLIVGEADCNNCVFKDISYGDCISNKNTLYLDISSNQDPTGFGNSCETVLTTDSRYSSYPFSLQGDSYVASDVNCNNCILGDISSSSCVNNNQRFFFNISTLPSFGKSCDDVVSSTYPNENFTYDQQTNQYFRDVSCGVVDNTFNKYGFETGNQVNYSLTNYANNELYFGLYYDDTNTNVVGFFVKKDFLGPYADFNNQNVNEILVGDSATIYDSPTSMDFPVVLNTDGFDTNNNRISITMGKPNLDINQGLIVDKIPYSTQNINIPITYTIGGSPYIIGLDITKI